MNENLWNIANVVVGEILQLQRHILEKEKKGQSQLGMLLAQKEVNWTPKDIYALIPGTCKYVTLDDKKNFADVTTALRWGGSPAIFGLAQCHHLRLCKWRNFPSWVKE